MLYKFSKANEYFLEICNDVFLKCVFVLSAILIEFSFGDISQVLLMAVFMLISFDFMTGILASVKSKIPITSRRVFDTALKYALYFIAISAGYFTELVIGTDLFIAKTIMIFLAITELVSILENVDKAGYPTPIHLINKLKEIIKLK